MGYIVFAIRFHRGVERGGGGGRLNNMVSGSECVWWCVGWEEEEGGLGEGSVGYKVFAIWFHSVGG